MLPFKTDIKGPAPSLDKELLKEHKDLDIIDETIKYFRINVLFKNFELKGTAINLVYIIDVIQEKKQM